MSINELTGQCVLITGASRGIGAATAHEMADKGMRVMLAARSVGDSEKIASEIRRNGGSAASIECNVAHFDQVQAAVHKTVSEFGSIDVVVNNAGTIDPISHLAESDP